MTSSLFPAIAAAGVFALATLGSGAARADAFQITFEPPKVQSVNASALCAAIGSGTCVVGTETFDTRASGSSFSTDYNTGGIITGNYNAVPISSANQYGGAGGSGNYAVAYGGLSYSVSLSTTLPNGINYFGYWLSALDNGNQVSFYRNGSMVYSFTPDDLINALGSCSGVNPYCTNPNPAFLGQNRQLYAFVNFFDKTGTFDEIRFREDPAVGGYESDNHTVGFVTGTSGTPVNNVPEPASLALVAMGLLSFGAIRRRG